MFRGELVCSEALEGIDPYKSSFRSFEVPHCCLEGIDQVNIKLLKIWTSHVFKSLCWVIQEILILLQPDQETQV